MLFAKIGKAEGFSDTLMLTKNQQKKKVMIEQKLVFFFSFLISLLLENLGVFLVLTGKSSYLTVTYWKIAIVQLVTWPRVILWNQNPGAQECLLWACLQTHSTWTFLTFTED